MKRCLCFLLVLILAAPLWPAALTEEETAEDTPEQAAETEAPPAETVDSWLATAEEALQQGTEGKQVLNQMLLRAETQNMQAQLAALCENIAAYENESYTALSQAIFREGGPLPVDVKTPQAQADEHWTVYDAVPVSDALREALSDPEAEFCFLPCLWSESQFAAAFGADYTVFVPSRPRAGYVCLLLADGAQSYPDTPWSEDRDGSFSRAVLDTVKNLADAMEENAPVLTGNPNLASSFWLIDITYPFYSWYGAKEAAGYDCRVSVRAMDAAGKSVIAECAAVGRLGETIYDWDENGVARAETPALSDGQGYEEFVRALCREMIRQRGEPPRLSAAKAERMIDSLMRRLAIDAADPWQEAILQSGVREVEVGEDQVISCLLRGFDPAASGLGQYRRAEDRRAWLQSALDNAAEYQTRVSLDVKDGEITLRSETSLMNKTRQMAENARTAFSGADMAAAILDEMFPAPVSEEEASVDGLLNPDPDFLLRVYAREDAADWNAPDAALAALFYAQRSRRLIVTGGPHALQADCLGASPRELLAQAEREALDELAALPSAEREEDALDALLLQKLAEQALIARKKADYAYSVQVDIDRLLTGETMEGYAAYLADFDYAAALDALLDDVRLLPEQAAQEMPSNGRISGGDSGESVILRVPSGCNPTYVQLRDEGTGEVSAASFIHPGKQSIVRVPAGEYRVYFCSGPYWYGTEELFASCMSRYMVSDPLRVKGSGYENILILDPDQDAEDGLVLIDTNVSEFWE